MKSTKVIHRSWDEVDIKIASNLAHSCVKGFFLSSSVNRKWRMVFCFNKYQQGDELLAVPDGRLVAVKLKVASLMSQRKSCVTS